MSLKFEGVRELKKALANNASLDAVRRIVKQNGAELDSRMQRKAVFTQGYSTGQTKRSIHLTLSNDDLTAEVEPGTEYSPYLEYGTRFMDAQPFVGPAFNEQKEEFKSDMDKLTR